MGRGQGDYLLLEGETANGQLLRVVLQVESLSVLSLLCLLLVKPESWVALS